MTDRTQDIVKAARSMFMRYGFTKTTMSDIAAEAGVARQTVYNAFAGKDDILRAVVRLTGQDSLKDVRASWSETSEIADKLEAFHRLAPLAWYDAMRAAPDWAALMEGMNSSAAEELCGIEAEWKADLAKLFDDATPASETKHADLADFFYSASLNAKHGCTDRAHLERRLATIRAATLALL